MTRVHRVLQDGTTAAVERERLHARHDPIPGGDLQAAGEVAGVQLPGRGITEQEDGAGGAVHDLAPVVAKKVQPVVRQEVGDLRVLELALEFVERRRPVCEADETAQLGVQPMGQLLQVVGHRDGHHDQSHQLRGDGPRRGLRDLHVLRVLGLPLEPDALELRPELGEAAGLNTIVAGTEPPTPISITPIVADLRRRRQIAGVRGDRLGDLLNAALEEVDTLEKLGARERVPVHLPLRLSRRRRRRSGRRSRLPGGGLRSSNPLPREPSALKPQPDRA
jgi:hypothetical protein